MALLNKLNNGWEIVKISFNVLKAHRELILFPVLSGASIILVIASFFTIFISGSGLRLNGIKDINVGTFYASLFIFYIINYFIVVFFNMALMHCTKLYFDGLDVSIGAGLRFSISRLKPILSWAVFAATIGVILKMIQDNTGWLGRITTAFIGFVWGISTFFVVPVIAYENVGPVDALKRSTGIMKEKWGESITANFSINIIVFLAICFIAIPAMAISAWINEQLGIILMAIGILLVLTVSSAINSIFISAIYNVINGDENMHFSKNMMDNIFVEK